MFKPNYETARKEAGFEWNIGTAVYAYIDLAGISLHEYNTNPSAGVEVFKEKYSDRVSEMFGDYVVKCGTMTPPVSYGHINFLNVPLIFPAGEGEVNYEHQHKSLDEWINIFRNNMEFRDMTEEGQFFIEYRKKLQEAYPDRHIHWAMGYEGPLTTAYELRDTDFFYDMNDNPKKTNEFLKYLTLNMIEYAKFSHKVNGTPEFNTEGHGMADDIASMIPPERFEELVVPYWNMFYSSMTSGKRHIHTEDHKYKSLKFFEKVNINTYDPGISHHLNPQQIRDNNRVPFFWRMGGFHFRDLMPDEVRDWVYKAVEDGTNKVFTYISKQMLDDDHIQKVKAFHEAAVNAKNMFDAGATRKEIGKLVSAEGRNKFWDKWPE